MTTTAPATPFDKTGQSIFFDVLGTKDVETAQECALMALKETIDYLGSKSNGEGGGGYGTDDPKGWLWGLRHQAKFESTIGDFFDAAAGLSSLTDQFAITTDRLPLMSKLPKGDPRVFLKWFPRQGDAFAVDAAGGTKHAASHYGSGPVFRMVIGMKRDKDGNPVVRGVNIVPGGQSGLIDSPFFDDQVKLWLANKTYPIRFHTAQVVEGATGREAFTPAK